MKGKGLTQKQIQLAVKVLAGKTDKDLSIRIRQLVSNLKNLSHSGTAMVSLSEHRNIRRELDVYIAVLRIRDGRKVPKEAANITKRSLSRRQGGGNRRKAR
jgi:hypothetical protein